MISLCLLFSCSEENTTFPNPCLSYKVNLVLLSKTAKDIHLQHGSLTPKPNLPLDQLPLTVLAVPIMQAISAREELRRSGTRLTACVRLPCMATCIVYMVSNELLLSTE